MSDALEGFAELHGWKKTIDPTLYPSKEEREELHRRIKDRNG